MVLAMLFWIGNTLSAPAWYWWVWGISVSLKILEFGMNMYKQGKDGE